MPENNQMMLSDREIRPTDDLINGIMGDKWNLWVEIMEYLDKSGKEFSGQWNWYNDGKQWLFKMTLKKKTIFWSALFNDTFRITFYFGDKAEDTILSADLPVKIKDDFINGKHYGKIRAISLKVYSSAETDIVKKLVEIKLQIR